MKHYFTDNTDLESSPVQFVFRYRQYDILFTSDTGVFSKSMIDYGSRVLLECFQKDEEQSLLDVGCGYGTFGICLKKVYPDLKTDMVDINDRALNLAKLNAQNNHVDVRIFKSSVYDEVEDMYDIIVSNPPVRAGKSVVMSILEGAYDHLHDHGSLWIVLQKKQGAPSAKKKMTEVFGNCEIVKRDKGYYILKSKKI